MFGHLTYNAIVALILNVAVFALTVVFRKPGKQPGAADRCGRQVRSVVQDGGAA
jgi:hypothetical protein